jgi:glycogen debranching enzyme
MWNEEDGLYYDIDDDGNQVKVKTVASFWPMLAGLCDLHKAERLLSNLKDPKTFWRVIPFPSLSADHKDYKPEGAYWLGSVWAPTNIMIIKGLDNFSFDDNNCFDSYGFRKFAVHASQKYLEALYNVYKQTGTIWENYSSEFFMPGFPSNLDFVGWSGCGPVMLLIENIIGIHADALKNEVIWDVDRVDRHGIENLKFGNVTTSLIAQKRVDINKPCILTIKTDHPYTLRVFKWDKKSKTVEIKKGTNNITIE